MLKYILSAVNKQWYNTTYVRNQRIYLPIIIYVNTVPDLYKYWCPNMCDMFQHVMPINS